MFRITLLGLLLVVPVIGSDNKSDVSLLQAFKNTGPIGYAAAGAFGGLGLGAALQLLPKKTIFTLIGIGVGIGWYYKGDDIKQAWKLVQMKNQAKKNGKDALDFLKNAAGKNEVSPFQQKLAEFFGDKGC